MFNFLVHSLDIYRFFSFLQEVTDLLLKGKKSWTNAVKLIVENSQLMMKLEVWNSVEDVSPHN